MDDQIHSTIKYSPIGIIHSPHRDITGMPIQPRGAIGIRGVLEIRPDLIEGLKDLDGFSHVILLYHFHHIKQMTLSVTPFLDTETRGVFATRAPKRPNPIGLSVVRLLSIEGNLLHVENVDILDGTPLLDIKPSVPAFDHFSTQRLGWLEKTQEPLQEKRSDDRFR